MECPLVSIIIPVYNGSNFLKECIDSALNQTYKNVEIIVVNDGSNDNGQTEKIAKSYGDKIRYYYKENGGVSSALNMGISQMKGEWFSWLSHDDLYFPDKIKRQMECLKRKNFHSESTIFVTSSQLIDSNGDYIFRPVKQHYGHITSEQMLKILLFKYTINGCTLLIHKSVFDKLGGFNEKYRYIQDWSYWVNLCISDFNFYVINDKLVKSRVHKDQVSSKERHIMRPELYDYLNNLLFQFSQYDYFNRNILLLIYYFSCFINKKDLIQQSKLLLKSKNILNFKIKLFGFFYRFKGKFKRTIRFIYNSFFIKRNRR